MCACVCLGLQRKKKTYCLQHHACSSNKNSSSLPHTPSQRVHDTPRNSSVAPFEGVVPDIWKLITPIPCEQCIKLLSHGGRGDIADEGRQHLPIG